MAPERDPHVKNAFKAMKNIGIDAETVKPVLKRLLKLYDRNWELIEEDNYRTLADAIFEEQDEKLKARESSKMIDEEAEPPLKRLHRADSEDQFLSNRDKGKGRADLEESGFPKSSSTTSIMEIPQSDSGYPRNEPHVNESPSGSRRRGPIQVKIEDIPQSDSGYPRNEPNVNESPSGSKRRGPIQVKIEDIPQSDSGYPRNELHVNEPQSGSKRRGPIQVKTIEKNSCSELAYVKKETSRPDSLESSNGHATVPWERQGSDSHSEVIPVVNGDRNRVFHKVNDITKGTEKVKISLLDEMGNEELPHFVYSPENTTYESAYVHVSLARISDEDSCSDCIGDCLSSSIPCACARNTGGEYAYNTEGLLSEKFLQDCIYLKISSKSELTEHMFYCIDCPLERAKNAPSPGKCMGHLLRKFIKECWRKCGCNMLCGNRVVQRGITRNLQVFLTGEGKGWGLRALEELPKGAFVCEYVGEILTNIELYERNKRSSGEDKHVYPVLLDADWATEGNLKDEDALCLDATNFGNVARFINHRCYDGNLIDVPVQVETPDHHYYHVAFFTTRKVNALEELTWDYEIDFDDNTHPIKAFRCRCGSSLCRDKKGKR